MFGLRAAVGTGVYLLFSCGSLDLAAQGDAQPAARGGQFVEQQHRRIDAALQKKANWQFIDVPLSKVAETLAERWGVGIHVDSKALEEYGIGTDVPVTISLADISGRSALNLLLRHLDLDWKTREGLLWISTPERLEAQLVTRSYPIGDLIEVSAGEYEYDRLIDVITSSIDPESWDAVGGPGAIEGVYAALVVSQVRSAHEQIEGLLQACRELTKSLRQQPDLVPQPHSVNGGRSTKIRNELDKPTAFEFRDAPLAAVVEHLGTLHDIPIVIDTRALEDFGIGVDTPVNFRVRRVPLRSGLQVMLEVLELSFAERDEVLMITNREEAEALLQLQLYSVGDLLAPLDPSAKEPLYLDGSDNANDRFDRLVSTITATIAPSTWAEVGGPCSLEPLQTPHFSALLISQTSDAHQQISSLLTGLRRVQRQERQRLDKATAEQPKTAEFYIKAYTLAADGPQPQQLVELILATWGKETWGPQETLLRGLGGKIVIRHTKRVHRRVQRLLQELGAVPPASGGAAAPGGGGLF